MESNKNDQCVSYVLGYVVKLLHTKKKLYIYTYHWVGIICWCSDFSRVGKHRLILASDIQSCLKQPTWSKAAGLKELQLRLWLNHASWAWRHLEFHEHYSVTFFYYRTLNNQVMFLFSNCDAGSKDRMRFKTY